MASLAESAGGMKGEDGGKFETCAWILQMFSAVVMVSTGTAGARAPMSLVPGQL